MSSRTYSRNAFETTLAGAVNDTATTVDVVSAANLSAPCYLVIDPESATVREYVKVTSINVNQLTVERGAAGSVGDVGHAHAATAKVRAVPVHQWLNDIFTDIEAGEAWQTAHLVGGSDPHPEYLTPAEGSALYLTQTVADGLYLSLAGGTITNFLTLHADPTSALHAATKAYVDAADVAAAAVDSAALSAHESAAEAAYVKLSRGSVQTLQDNLNAESVLPRTDNTYDLGSATYSWQDLFVFNLKDENGTIRLDLSTMRFTGSLDPSVDLTYDLGDAALTWRRVYAQAIYDEAGSLKIDVSAGPFLPTTTDLGDLASHAHSELSGIGTSDHHVRFSTTEAIAACDNGAISTGGVATAGPSDVTSTTYAKVASFTVTRPSGWASTKVVVRGFAQYAGVDNDQMQLQGYLSVDGTAGAVQQAGVVAIGEDPAISLVATKVTSDSTINIDVYARNSLTSAPTGAATGKYVNIDYALYRVS